MPWWMTGTVNLYEDEKDVKETLWCSVARDKYDTPNYHLCGLEGKFFEKNTDNSR